MSLFSRAFSGDSEKRTLFSEVLPRWSQESAGFDGVSRGGAMSLTTFFACTRLLADAVSSLPLRAYKTSGEVPLPLSPQPALLANLPYPGISWRDWLWMLMQSLAVTGNAYCLIASRDANNRPTALMPVHPRLVTVRYPDADEMDWAEPVYSINGNRVPAGDMVHIKRFPLANALTGMSPIEMAADAIGLSLDAEKYGRRWFKDSAVPSGVLSTEQPLTEAQVKQTLKQWLLAHRDRRMPAVMGGGLKWTSISVTPEESQFLQTRSFQRSEIAMWFGVPPHMIGDTDKSTSWGSGIEAQSIGFVKFTLEPWLNCIEQAISLLLPRGTEAMFDLRAILRGDEAARWDTYEKGRLVGVLSVNDIRIAEGFPPIGPEGDIRITPMNYVPLGTPPEQYLGNKTSGSAEEGNS